METLKKIITYIKLILTFIYNLLSGSFKTAMIFSATMIFFLSYMNFEVLRDTAMKIDASSMQKHITAIILIAFFSTLFGLWKDPALKAINWVIRKVRK